MNDPFQRNAVSVRQQNQKPRSSLLVWPWSKIGNVKFCPPRSTAPPLLMPARWRDKAACAFLRKKQHGGWLWQRGEKMNGLKAVSFPFPTGAQVSLSKGRLSDDGERSNPQVPHSRLRFSVGFFMKNSFKLKCLRATMESQQLTLVCSTYHRFFFSKKSHFFSS